MKKIFKYVFTGAAFSEDGETIRIPKGFEVIKAGLQMDKLVVWVKVDTSTMATEPLTIFVKATGDWVSDSMEYVDTYFTGPLVWHIFKE